MVPTEAQVLSVLRMARAPLSAAEIAQALTLRLGERDRAAGHIFTREAVADVLVPLLARGEVHAERLRRAHVCVSYSQEGVPSGGAYTQHQTALCYSLKPQPRRKQP